MTAQEPLCFLRNEAFLTVRHLRDLSREILLLNREPDSQHQTNYTDDQISSTEKIVFPSDPRRGAQYNSFRAAKCMYRIQRGLVSRQHGRVCVVRCRLGWVEEVVISSNIVSLSIVNPDRVRSGCKLSIDSGVQLTKRGKPSGSHPYNEVLIFNTVAGSMKAPPRSTLFALLDLIAVWKAGARLLPFVVKVRKICTRFYGNV
mmetsp:Transcript_45935/g.113983  ORF Transcript_45935/g.113983 Transcript_45935/m.113983 type:complete len:202 (+) Transcript_45935:251-856(+)